MNTNKVSPVSSRQHPAKHTEEESKLFTKENYKWMLIGLVILALGFFLMSGGKSTDPNVFNDHEIYSFRRITLAPILIVAGLLVEIYAIMKKQK
jgi:FtsH-binding integral membrane protein